MGNFSVIQSIKSILAFLDALITPNTPLTAIDKKIIDLGMPARSGVSAQRVATNIINRKSEAGIPAVPSEQDLRMERIRVECMLEELQKYAKVEVVIPRNSISVTVYTFTPAGATPIGFGVNDIEYVGIAKGAGFIR